MIDVTEKPIIMILIKILEEKKIDVAFWENNKRSNHYFDQKYNNRK